MSWGWDDLPETQLVGDFEPGDCAPGYEGRQVKMRQRAATRRAAGDVARKERLRRSANVNGTKGGGRRA